MRATSECPIDAVGSLSSLASILESDVSRRYYMTVSQAKAILGRVRRNGQELPDVLVPAFKATLRGWIGPRRR
jgi:hypothetical protein